MAKISLNRAVVGERNRVEILSSSPIVDSFGNLLHVGTFRRLELVFRKEGMTDYVFISTVDENDNSTFVAKNKVINGRDILYRTGGVNERLVLKWVGDLFDADIEAVTYDTV